MRARFAPHLLDAGPDLAFVKDWLEDTNTQNTTIYARLTTATLDAQTWKVHARQRVVYTVTFQQYEGLSSKVFLDCLHV